MFVLNSLFTFQTDLSENGRTQLIDQWIGALIMLIDRITIMSFGLDSFRILPCTHKSILIHSVM